MADIFPAEEFDDWNDDGTSESTEIKVIIEEADESDVMLNNEESSSQKLEETEELLINPDDLLPPVEKLEKYANSEIVFNRQVVARNVLETLRLVSSEPEVDRVFAVLHAIAEDYDPNVRTELIVQLPLIAAYCKEAKLNNAVVQHIVPLLVNSLEDEHYQVRKAAQSTLISLLEEKLLSLKSLDRKICPLILLLTDNHPEDLRIDAIILMSKVMVLLGKDLAEAFFFERFFALCADRTNNVRKTCASVFGDICKTVGTQVTEDVLLAKFFALCEDTAWCVRKACVENFMQVSCVVSRDTRSRELSSLYMVLLADQSRWVRLTAYQALGPFISTFADPNKTGLRYINEFDYVMYDESILHKGKNVSLDEFATANEHGAETKSQPPMCNGLCDFTSSPPLPSENNSCDSNAVPRAATANCASEIPAISCHVGSYCTVIEVNGDCDTNSCRDDDLKTVTREWDGLGNDSSRANSYPVTVNGQAISSSEHSQNGDSSLPNGFLDSDAEMCANRDSTQCANVNCDVDDVDCESLNSCQTSENLSTNCGNVTETMLNKCESTISMECKNSSSDKPENSISNDCKSYHSNDCESLNSTDCENLNSTCQASSDSNECLSKDLENCIDSDHIFNDSNKDTNCESDSESAFNQFQYWRCPLPDIDLTSFKPTVFSYSANRRVCGRPITKSNLFDIQRDKEAVLNHIGEEELSPRKPQLSPYDQDIVPADLLLQYVSMVDEVWAQTTDAEIARHCAYSLPAVALTLGRRFWPCIRETFNALASDLQGFIMMWKVRRTVASAMHRLAHILGPEITSADLLPVFSNFIRDMDEVRIGVLQHLYPFLEVLKPDERVQFLPCLREFLVSNETDSNEKNWRFRLILAEQLVPIAGLYEPEQVCEHLVPLALTLVKDKVCAVRLASIRVMGAVMLQLGRHPTPDLTRSAMRELTERFVHSPRYAHRQLFAYACAEFAAGGALPPAQFAEEALPHLLYLCWDRVANVRIAIARCLVNSVWPLEVFSGASSPHRELLLETIHTLQSDTDPDVRSFANTVPAHDCSCLVNSVEGENVTHVEVVFTDRERTAGLSVSDGPFV